MTIFTHEINGKSVNAVKKKEGSTECVFWDSSTSKQTSIDRMKHVPKGNTTITQ